MRKITLSKHGRIHSKDRNRLLNSRIERILAIQTYYQSFHRKNKQINHSETESQYESEDENYDENYPDIELIDF